MNNIIVSVDWLSCTFRGTLLQSNLKYSSVPTNLNSQLFHLVSLIVDVSSNEEIAIAYSHPRSPVMRKDTIVIKLNNECLYSREPFTLMHDIENSFGLIYNNINRLDVCADFISIANTSPYSFCQKIIDNEFYKKNSRILRLQFSEHGAGDLVKDEITKKMKYLINCEVIADKSRNSGLRFGTRKSECCIYLYNKTKELIEVKDKPYIREMWDKSFMAGRDVWRLEFSLKGKLLEKDLYNNFHKDVFYSRCLDEFFQIYDTYSQSKIHLFDNILPNNVYPYRSSQRKSNGNRYYSLLIGKLCQELQQLKHIGDKGVKYDLIVMLLQEYAKDDFICKNIKYKLSLLRLDEELKIILQNN